MFFEHGPGIRDFFGSKKKKVPTPWNPYVIFDNFWKWIKKSIRNPRGRYLFLFKTKKVMNVGAASVFVGQLRAWSSKSSNLTKIRVPRLTYRVDFDDLRNCQIRESDFISCTNHSAFWRKSREMSVLGYTWLHVAMHVAMHIDRIWKLNHNDGTRWWVIF